MTNRRVEFLTGHHAHELLMMVCPTVHQFIKKRLKDCFTRYHTGETAGEWLDQPAAYCVVRRCFFANGKTYIVATYHFFHRHDWSDSWNPFVRWADSHDFDFEGCTIFWEQSGDASANLVVTQAHDDLLFYRLRPGEWPHVYIASCSHAIFPREDLVESRGPECRIYKPGEIELINIESFAMRRMMREAVAPMFKRFDVKMPWEVTDWRIRRQFGKKGVRSLYDDPEAFLGFAGDLGLLSPEHAIFTSADH